MLRFKGRVTKFSFPFHAAHARLKCHALASISSKTCYGPVSNRYKQVPWPPHSNDTNPLFYYFHLNPAFHGSLKAESLTLSLSPASRLLWTLQRIFHSDCFQFWATKKCFQLCTSLSFDSTQLYNTNKTYT